MEFKVCTKCGGKKPVSEFYRQKIAKDGFRTQCKLCVSAYSKEYRKTNKEKVKVQIASWNVANKERISNSNKAYNKAHRNERNLWFRNKRERSPSYRLSSSISVGVNQALHDKKNGRRWEFLVGYTLNDLKKHIEKQFIEGMTWDNYGRKGWHIDHIIPKSVFNYTEPEHEDFKRCWALSNLRPLWAFDNMSKSNKLTKHYQPSLAL